ncbi:hypothetical protein J6590_052505 [Homalodisca vitripennis]|nr:hypothetical protein J6590_052505 [Homalodisca vitripennis]
MMNSARPVLAVSGRCSTSEERTGCNFRFITSGLVAIGARTPPVASILLMYIKREETRSHKYADDYGLVVARVDSPIRRPTNSSSHNNGRARPCDRESAAARIRSWTNRPFVAALQSTLGPGRQRTYD